jgi:hypothetical protein
VRLICELALPAEPSELAQLRHEVRSLGLVADDEQIVLAIDELFTLALRSGATSAVTRLFADTGETSVSIATDAPIALTPMVDSLTEMILRHVAREWGRRSTVAGTEWWATLR